MPAGGNNNNCDMLLPAIKTPRNALQLLVADLSMKLRKNDVLSERLMHKRKQCGGQITEAHARKLLQTRRRKKKERLMQVLEALPADPEDVQLPQRCLRDDGYPMSSITKLRLYGVLWSAGIREEIEV